VQVVVKLTPAAAKRLRTSTGDRTTVRALKDLEHDLAPLHPNTRDASLESFFVADVEDPAEATRVVERLLKDPAVEAAYVKPADEPA
jgi:hypothetical protein